MSAANTGKAQPMSSGALLNHASYLLHRDIHLVVGTPVELPDLNATTHIVTATGNSTQTPPKCLP